MTHKQKLSELKSLNLQRTNVSLAIVKEYKKNRVSQYDIKYVSIDEKIEKRLKIIIINKVRQSNSVEKYTFDCPEPEEDQIRSINYEETDFYRIAEILKSVNPEENTIDDVEELVSAKHT